MFPIIFQIFYPRFHIVANIKRWGVLQDNVKNGVSKYGDRIILLRIEQTMKTNDLLKKRKNPSLFSRVGGTVRELQTPAFVRSRETQLAQSYSENTEPTFY